MSPKPSLITKEKSPATDISVVLDKMLAAAVIAPSAHNTQPWQFASKNTELEVYLQQDRCLPASDPTSRQAYLSVGCAIMNAVVAAAAQGYHAYTALLPDDSNKQLAARLTITASNADKQIAQLERNLQTRRTDRSPYDKQPLTETELQAMPSLHESSVVVVHSIDQIKRIAELSYEGTYTALEKSAFKKELAQWVRNNWTKKSDGMPGYATGIPAPLSLIAPLLVKVLPLHKQEAPVAKEQINSASAIAVVVTAGDEPLDWLQAGMVMERLWLEATEAGVAVMPQTALIEGSIAVRQKLQQLLQTSRLPQAVLRLGHSTLSALPRELPRRTVNDCLRSV